MGINQEFVCEHMKSVNSNCLWYLLILVIASPSLPQNDSSCGSNPSVCNAVEDSFCHKISQMCVCQNGASTYPKCGMNNGRQCNNCHQHPEYCQENPGCCNVKCSRFEMCHNGKCECMYGKTHRNHCRRCMQVCGRGEVCHKSRRSGKYHCTRKRLPAIDCSDMCGVGSKCKRVRGVVHCTACGPGKRLDDGMCATAYTWSPWSLWSDCSITCGKGGKRTRRRRCNVPEKCPGETREEGGCVKKLPVCYGEWTAWGPYTSCSATCGDGLQDRFRKCEGGPTCLGEHFSSKRCRGMMCNSD